mgnify:CR=1 FL=1
MYLGSLKHLAAKLQDLAQLLTAWSERLVRLPHATEIEARPAALGRAKKSRHDKQSRLKTNETWDYNDDDRIPMKSYGYLNKNIVSFDMF